MRAIDDRLLRQNTHYRHAEGIGAGSLSRPLPNQNQNQILNDLKCWLLLILFLSPQSLHTNPRCNVFDLTAASMHLNMRDLRAKKCVKNIYLKILPAVFINPQWAQDPVNTFSSSVHAKALFAADTQVKSLPKSIIMENLKVRLCCDVVTMLRLRRSGPSSFKVHDKYAKVASCHL